MADNQTGCPQRLRLDSRKLCKDCYFTVDKLIHSEDEGLTKLFWNKRKAYVGCLLRETPSQLWSAEKLLLGSSVTQIDVGLREIQRRIETIMNQVSIVHAIEALINNTIHRVCNRVYQIQKILSLKSLLVLGMITTSLNVCELKDKKRT